MEDVKKIVAPIISPNYVRANLEEAIQEMERARKRETRPDLNAYQMCLLEALATRYIQEVLQAPPKG